MESNISSLILNPYLAPVFFFLYLAGLAIYRLYFHPLARFPGPKLAALSQWYEFYYDVVLKGRYIFKIKELHEKYGKQDSLALAFFAPYLYARAHVDRSWTIDPVFLAQVQLSV